MAVQYLDDPNNPDQPAGNMLQRLGRGKPQGPQAVAQLAAQLPQQPAVPPDFKAGAGYDPDAKTFSDPYQQIFNGARGGPALQPPPQPTAAPPRSQSDQDVLELLKRNPPSQGLQTFLNGQTYQSPAGELRLPASALASALGLPPPRPPAPPSNPLEMAARANPIGVVNPDDYAMYSDAFAKQAQRDLGMGQLQLGMGNLGVEGAKLGYAMSPLGRATALAGSIVQANPTIPPEALQAGVGNFMTALQGYAGPQGPGALTMFPINTPGGPGPAPVGPNGQPVKPPAPTAMSGLPGNVAAALQTYQVPQDPSQPFGPKKPLLDNAGQFLMAIDKQFPNYLRDNFDQFDPAAREIYGQKWDDLVNAAKGNYGTLGNMLRGRIPGGRFPAVDPEKIRGFFGAHNDYDNAVAAIRDLLQRRAASAGGQ